MPRHLTTLHNLIVMSKIPNVSHEDVNECVAQLDQLKFLVLTSNYNHKTLRIIIEKLKIMRILSLVGMLSVIFRGKIGANWK